MRHMESNVMNESIKTILNLIRLENDQHTLAKNLSGGMKRRLSIGISLVGNPKVGRIIHSHIYYYYFIYST